jgi:hypothetical protein
VVVEKIEVEKRREGEERSDDKSEGRWGETFTLSTTTD